MISALENRTTNVISLTIAGVLFSAMTVWALQTASSLPDVYFSYATNDCVKVVNYTDTEYSCENLPRRFYHVWVE